MFFQQHKPHPFMTRERRGARCLGRSASAASTSAASKTASAAVIGQCERETSQTVHHHRRMSSAVLPQRRPRPGAVGVKTEASLGRATIGDAAAVGNDCCHDGRGNSRRRLTGRRWSERASKTSLPCQPLTRCYLAVLAFLSDPAVAFQPVAVRAPPQRHHHHQQQQAARELRRQLFASAPCRNSCDAPLLQGSFTGRLNRQVIPILFVLWTHVVRYSTLRSAVLRWDDFLDGGGKFLRVMWDAPVALRDLLFPARDDDHERPEAAMLREGLARAQAILQEASDHENRRGNSGGSGSAHGKGRGEGKETETEVKRLSGLDLGEGDRFAALAEKCLELHDGGHLYRVCPFKEAKQDRRSLGWWRRWEGGLGEPGDGYRSMLFDGGSRGKNSRQRSCEVMLECGPEDALVAGVEELEIGFYRLVLETPLVCTEAALTEAATLLEPFGIAEE